MRILIVEDHQDSARALVRVLTTRGHVVDSAGCAADALRLCGGGQSYDLLISDIGLPDADGCDLLGQIRGARVRRAIALTGFAGVADVERSLAAGFDAHVSKPVDVVALLATVDEVGG